MKQCPKCSESIKGKAAFCPSCGEKIGRQSAEEKRSRLTENSKSGKVPFLAIGALVIVGALAFAAVSIFKPGASQNVSAGGGSDTTLTFNLADFDDGAPKYYSYNAPGGTVIRFFVLKSSDGVVRAAFDACDVCYASKKGYRQEGDFMVCNNCGQRFLSTKINEVRGGCNPAPLERAIEGSTLVVAVADILTGARYF